MRSFKLSADHSLTIYPREVSGPLVFSALFFFLFAFVGFVISSVYPTMVESSMGSLIDMAEGVSDLSFIGLLAFIFLNNSFVALMASVGGLLFAFLPFFIIVVNGFILGIVYHLIVSTISSGFFLTGVLPHGIIEIPAILFSTAIGIWLGLAFMDLLFKGNENRVSIRKKIKRVFYTYFTIIIPLLFLAALIEMFLTPVFLEIFYDPGNINGLTQ